MMDQSLKAQLLSYRNAYFQGTLKQNTRNGPGILINDSGLILVCNWVNDLPVGKALAFLNNQEYSYLQFNRGQLDGYCYSCSEREMIVIKFDKGRPVQRHIYVNFYDFKVRILAHRNGSYQPVQEMKLEQKQQELIISRYLGVKMSIPPLLEYLQAQFCEKANLPFELKYSPNGNATFRYIDKSNPLSLGFTVSKKEQLISYGSYLEGKLHGFGCKVDSNGTSEGQFEAGHLHGYGLVSSNNRFTFGRFQMGSLLETANSQDRGRDSLEKLKILKKKEHVQSIYFQNNYVSHDILTFKGISETKKPPVRQFSEPEISTVKSVKSSLSSSRIKGSNVSLNQLINSKIYVRQFQEPHISVMAPPQMGFSQRIHSPQNYQREIIGNSKVSQREGIEDRRWQMGTSGARQYPISRFPFQ